MQITIAEILLFVAAAVSLYFTTFWLLVFLDKKSYEKDNMKIKVKKLPLVTVAIPAFNEQKTIRGTIESVIELDYPKDRLQVIVINDGSTDKTRQEAQKIITENKEFNILLINQENKGKGAALNQALKLADGEYFASMDADSYVDDRQALKKMLKHFHKKTAAVLPLLKVKEPKTFIEKVQSYEYIVNAFFKKIMSTLNCVHVTPGPFSLYKTKVLTKLGGYDENNLTEDLEIALRIQKHHYKITQLLDATIGTYAPTTIKALYRQRNRWYKGSVVNAFKHKTMMFNPKYGDFGMMQMPIIIISGIISIVMVGAVLTDVLKGAIQYFMDFSRVNFDIITFIKNMSFNFSIWDLSYVKILMMIAMIVISIAMLIVSHKLAKEKIIKRSISKDIVPITAFMFVHYIFLGVLWMGIIVDFAIGKYQRW